MANASSSMTNVPMGSDGQIEDDADTIISGRQASTSRAYCARSGRTAKDGRDRLYVTLDESQGLKSADDIVEVTLNLGEADTVTYYLPPIDRDSLRMFS